jgi:pyrimidine-specific ribonucleoside hydrolase
VALLRLIFILALAALSMPVARAQPVLIDTDAGSDDFMAIAFLLSHPSVRIEAITVANGIAHVEPGARNLVRLLELAGRREIPVFPGRGAPLRGKAEFPAEWRRISDELPGVALPAATRQPEKRRAADYLIGRLKNGRQPVRILALGPLTNLGEALQRDASIAEGIQEIVIMGGAVRAPGNLADGEVFHTANKTAEWNIFIDPWAARIVFRSGVHIRLIPLDSTNKVPIGAEFLREFQSTVRSPLGKLVAQVLAADHEMIDQGYFYAWDPLAAVALLYPRVVKSSPLHIEVRQDPPEEGRTVQAAGPSNAEVAMDADATAFRKMFLEAFEK